MASSRSLNMYRRHRDFPHVVGTATKDHRCSGCGLGILKNGRIMGVKATAPRKGQRVWYYWHIGCWIAAAEASKK